MSQAGNHRPVTSRHYQAVGGLALLTVFLIQWERGTAVGERALLVNLFAVFLGALSLLYRLRISPVLVLLAITVPMLAENYHAGQFGDFHTFRFLDPGDVLLCVATLTYLIAQYRLHGLWFGVLPGDPRVPADEAGRSERSLSAVEIVALMVAVPAAAIAAQLACLLLERHWTLLDLPPRWQQFLVIAWMLLLAMFLAAQFFRYWRRTQLDRPTALVMLQDMLWRETRAEQRSIQRWAVWQRLREKR